MEQVNIPVECGNKFDLPAVCLISGVRDDIVWKRRRWSYTPPWVYFLILVNLLVMIIVALIVSKNARLELPYNREAYRSWRFRLTLLTLTILASIAGGFVLLFMGIDQEVPVVAIGGLLAGTILFPVTAWILWGRNRGPRVVKITDTTATFAIPSAEAALEITDRFIPVAPPPTALPA